MTTKKIVYQIITKGADKAEKSFENLGNEIDDSTKDVGELNKSFGVMAVSATKGATQATKSVKTMNKSTSTAADNLKKIGVAALTLVGVKKAFDVTLGSAIKFQKGMTEVSTLIGDAGASTARLTAEALELQKRFGTDQADLSSAYYNAISSGAADASTATDLLATANKLAIGGVTDLATAVDGITSTLNAYGLTADNSTSISDAMFIAMRAGKTTVEELSNSIGNGAPIAAQLGVTYQELLGSVSAITTGGVSTSEAMTQVRASMVSLLKPTTDMKAAMHAAGITNLEASIQTDGLNGVLKKIVGTTDGSAGAITKMTGRVEAANAVMALTGDKIGPKFAAIMGDMGVAAENSGAATEAAYAEVANTVEEQWKRLTGTMKAIATQMGTALLPVLSDVLSIIENSGKWFQENAVWIEAFGAAAVTAAVGTAALGVAMNAAAIGAGVMAAATTTATVATTAFGAAIAFLTGPIGLAVAGIALLSGAVAGLVVWQKKAAEEEKAIAEDKKASQEAVKDNLLVQLAEEQGALTAHRDFLQENLDTQIGQQEGYGAKIITLKEEQAIAEAEQKAAQDEAALLAEADKAAAKVEGLKKERDNFNSHLALLEGGEKEAAIASRMRDLTKLEQTKQVKAELAALDKEHKKLSLERTKKEYEEKQKAREEALKKEREDQDAFFAWEVSTDTRRKEFEKQSLANKISTAQTGIAAIINLSKTGNKSLGEVGKAAAIANATIDTYRAANAAYASLAGIPVVGPGLGIAAAAGAIAAGVANVEMIQSQKFANGGVVQGSSFGGDKVPAFLNSGEEVLTQRDRGRIRDQLNGPQSGNNDEMLGAILSQLAQPVVIQNADGVAFAEVVREGVRAGVDIGV